MTVQALWVVVVGAVVLTAAAGPLRVERVEGGLRLDASLSRATYGPGEVVEVAFTATNTANTPLSVTFTSGQRFDLVIRRPRGDAVWQWSSDKAFIQVIQMVTLQPGENLSFRIPWDQRDYQGRRVDAGPYEAVAVFMGRTASAREIRLPPLAFTIAGP